MQKCYADEDLKISKEKFEEPVNLSIELDCDKYKNPENGEEVIEEVDFNQ